MAMYITAKSIFARSASEIIRCLDQIPAIAAGSHTVLFSISPASSWPESSLTELVSHLNSLPRSLGCLSAPVQLRGHAKTRPAAEGSILDSTVCSVAVFDRQFATPFRSTIPGREATQVGRWHSFRKAGDIKLQDHQLPETGVDWESVWAQKDVQPKVPEELETLSPEDVQTVIYLSDTAPEGLNNALQYFTHANKVGILSHSTPFLTGRPHTLFYNGEILSSGAVGLCIHRNPSRPTSLNVYWPDLDPVTPTLTVTESESNLIHSINGVNPSRLLLNAIEKLESSAKDDTYYVGVKAAQLEPKGSPSDQIYGIMSGDPSRGTIALEGESAPMSGAEVQIFRSRSDLRSTITSRRGINFCKAYSDGIDVLLDPPHDPDGAIVLDDTFLAVSENGLIMNPRTTAQTSVTNWKSTLPGSSFVVR